jgi:hypothetical protein
VGGLGAFLTGLHRLPHTVTIGYELHFEDLWEPVALVGLLGLVVGWLVSLLALVCRAREAGPRAAPMGSPAAPGPRVLLVLALALGVASHLAHGEAVRRSDEAQAAFMAELDGRAAPHGGPVRFCDDWRQTAYLSRHLFLGAEALLGALLLLCARSARRVPSRRGRELGVV